MSNETPPREPPILAEKHYAAPSIFDAANLMREARRQKGLPAGDIPPMCVLDPDGDLVDYLRARGLARQHPAWACYHTTLDVFSLDGAEVGIVGRAMGASFAVLMAQPARSAIAEELFVSGCRLLLSVTSAGQITPLGPTPYFVLIEQALRDEGTSYHYLPPARYSWTTDAPFRETAQAIAAARAEGIAMVEMEAQA